MATEGIRLGVVSAALSPDPRQAARMSRELGFAGLQFDAASGAVDLTELSGSGRREFRHILTTQDQQLVGLRADAGPKGLGLGADVDRVIARLDRVMEAAAGLGAALVCADLGPLPTAPRVAKPTPKISAQQAGLILLPTSSAPEPEPPSQPTPPPDPAFVGQVNDALAELGRHADRYSVVLAFRSELSSLGSLRQAVVGANCAWFGVDLDPVAVARDEWDLDETFSQLGPLIRHVRGRDALVGSERRTKPTPIGQGNVDWGAMLANLEETDYRGWVTIDPIDLMDRFAAAGVGLSFLRKRLGL
ncbi:MAG TPA: TIM barrel protein [Tepidisphaeraceae bacterium]|nr:TIM barrel protein [Tepidisphaeraceae bacterium]